MHFEIKGKERKLCSGILRGLLSHQKLALKIPEHRTGDISAVKVCHLTQLKFFFVRIDLIPSFWDNSQNSHFVLMSVTRKPLDIFHGLVTGFPEIP